MASESFEKLVDEIKKFSGFRFPEDVRSASSEATKSNSIKSTTLPISSSNSPIVKAISTIFQCKKIQQSLQNLSIIICDSISNEVFSNQALNSVVKLLETQSSTSDIDYSLKLIQFASGILPKYSSNLHLIKSLLSIVLSFLSSKNKTVTSAAFAAFQQMISVEFKFIETSKMEDLSPENQQNLKIIVKNGIANKFDDPLYVIAFLIINDIANLTIGKQTMWLRIEKIPPNILFELWELIITTQHSFLKKSLHIMRVIENSALTQSPSLLTLSFHCSFICCFYAELKQSATALFSLYLEKLTEGEETFITSILLFRNLLIREPYFLSFFSENSELVLQLLERVNGMISIQKYSNSCEIKLQQGLPKEEFIPQYKLELAFLCINSLTGKKSDNLEKYWRSLVVLLIKLVRLCDKGSSELVFRTYSSFIMAMSEDKYQQGRSILIRILCSLVSQQKILRKELDFLEETANDLLHTNKGGFWFKGKRLFAYHVLTKIVTSNPEFFSSLYKRLFNALTQFEGAKLESTWTKKLDDDNLGTLCKDLCCNSPFSIDFLLQVFLLNEEKFSFIWDIVSVEMPSLFRNIEVEDNLLQLLSTVTTKLFNTTNEETILKTIADILNKENNISLNCRMKLMETISTIIKHSGSTITKGWTYILTAISVENAMNETVILTSAFMVLNCICTDHLQKISEDDLSRIISLIMAFCTQNADLNIALTALGLNWNIIPLVYNNSKYWKQILSSMMELFNDKRGDVSSGALSTFFTLLTSNSQQMPMDVYHHLLENCLIPILLGYETFPTETLDVTQHALCEICHCACSFWQQFSTITSFRSTFWPLLIQKQHSFIAHCNNPDIAANALQFYEDCMPSSVIPYELRYEILKSITSIFSILLAREPPKSLVISEMGKFIQRTLPTQKEFLTVEMLKLWNSMIAEICLTLPSDSFVNITSQKCLGATLQLMPLNNDLLQCLVYSIAEIAQKTTKPLFFNTAVQCLIKEFESIDKTQYIIFLSSCSPLYHMQASKELLKTILVNTEKTPTIGNNDETRDLFRILVNIAKEATDITDFIDLKLVDMILYVPTEDRIDYIKCNEQKPNILLTMWVKYCDKENSELYSEEFTQSCFYCILNALIPSIESGNMKVLEFIERAKVTRQDFGGLKNCNRWHIHYYTHSIAKLLNCGKEEVVESAKRMLKTITEDISMMC